MSLNLCGDIERLHQKLQRLIGDPMLDRIVTAYDDLYRCLVDNLHYWPPINQIKWDNQEATKVMSFAVRMPGTIAKLAQLASASTSRAQTAAWANRTLCLLESIEVDPVFRPEVLHQNPLYVWGGAVLSGFLGAKEASSRVRCLLTTQPLVLETFVAQGWALARVLLFLQIPNAARFAEFWEAACDDVTAD
jgi:hypothetical protein